MSILFEISQYYTCLQEGCTYHTSKINYRSMSILPVSSKIPEKLLQKQLLVFFDNILSKFQHSFREFAKLRALCAFVPYVPLRLTRLRTFAPYAPSYLRALRAFVPYVPSGLTCLDFYAP